MGRSRLEIGLIAGLIAPAMTVGCDSKGDEDTGSATVADTGMPGDDGMDGDDGGATMGTSGADGSGTGAADASDDGMVDPTEGEVPPEIECGDGVHTGPLLLSPDNPGAVPIETLNGISIIDGDLLIDSTNYVNLDFLHCLVEVRGDVQIFGNHFLTDLSGTDGITKIGRLPALNPTPTQPNFVDEGKGSVTVSSNPMLSELNGFNGIVQIGEQDTSQPPNMQLSPQSLVIRTNDALTTITGFGSLELIFQSLIVQENPVLLDIDGLQGLKGIGGAFSVTRNESLCLSSVNAVGGGLDVLGDPEHSTTTQNDPSC